LKQPGRDKYFDKLLARIHDIRLSEKVFWHKRKNIYATNIDYESRGRILSLSLTDAE